MAGLSARVYRRNARPAIYQSVTPRRRTYLIQWSLLVVESKNDFRKALSAIVDVRSREAARQVGYRRQHQLIGALTKRP
jgi:hypothetical protein